MLGNRVALAATMLLMVASLISGGAADGQPEACGQSAGNQRAPVMLEDGQGGNFLILNQDEVKANSQLLSLLSQASKEDVEEIVSENPRFQDMILTRIKGAVEERQKSKQQQQQQQQMAKGIPTSASIDVSAGAPTGASTKGGGGGQLGLPKANPNYTKKIGDDETLAGDEAAEDDGDDEEEDQVDEQQLAKWRAQIKGNALKMFRIGKGLRERIAAFTRRRAPATTTNNGSNQKTTTKKKKTKPRWPHFHYKISTS